MRVNIFMTDSILSCGSEGRAILCLAVALLVTQLQHKSRLSMCVCGLENWHPPQPRASANTRDNAGNCMICMQGTYFRIQTDWMQLHFMPTSIDV